MAFLGDFGKFFGLGTSEEVLGDVGEAVGGYFGGPSGAKSGRKAGQFVGKATSNLSGEDTADQPTVQSAVPVRTLQDTPPQEDFTSGGNVPQQRQAFIAPFVGAARSILPTASRFLKSPTGVATGVGTAVGTSFVSSMGGQRERPILTQSRRNKARVRRLVMMLGIPGAVEFLQMQTGMPVTEADVVNLLLRTFRNDGAYITRAQVRNLRKTTNKFKTLEKQVKEAVKMTATTRRTSTRKMSSMAGVTQIKN